MADIFSSYEDCGNIILYPKFLKYSKQQFPGHILHFIWFHDGTICLGLEAQVHLTQASALLVSSSIMNFNLTFKIFIFPCFPCHQEWRSVFTLIIVNVTMSSPSSGLPLSIYAAAAAAKSLQSCPTLCDPIDRSPPGYPVPVILQARALEWVAISFSRGSSQPRDQTQVSHTAGGFFTI